MYSSQNWKRTWKEIKREYLSEEAMTGASKQENISVIYSCSTTFIPRLGSRHSMG